MNHEARQGFTLIELMLAMGFISALLLAIAMSTLQIGNIYNRGLTLKDVNQAGRALSSELQRSLSASTSFDISNNSKNLVTTAWGGRLCTEQYSYIWNYGEALNKSSSNYSSRNQYAGSINDIKFIKVADFKARYCLNSTSKIDDKMSTELLDSEQHDLAIHYFNISSQSTASDPRTGQQLYSIEFIIGTNDQTALNGVTSNGSPNIACIAPGKLGSDPSYCSVGQFDIVVRAGGPATEGE